MPFGIEGKLRHGDGATTKQFGWLAWGILNQLFFTHKFNECPRNFFGGDEKGSTGGN